MKNKPKLTPEQIRTLKSMSVYWDEIASRPDHENIAVAELNVMVHAVQSPMQVLLIIANYVEQLKENANGQTAD